MVDRIAELQQCYVGLQAKLEAFGRRLRNALRIEDGQCDSGAEATEKCATRNLAGRSAHTRERRKAKVYDRGADANESSGQPLMFFRANAGTQGGENPLELIKLTCSRKEAQTTKIKFEQEAMKPGKRGLFVVSWSPALPSFSREGVSCL